VSTKSTSKFADSGVASVRPREAYVHRERELLIETFYSFYEQFGEEQASLAMKNNKKLREHLVPLRKIMEADIAERLSDAKESQSIVEKQLTEFKNAIPVDSSDEKAAFRAVINLVKKATPESIGHLKQFAKVISGLTSHMADYSENVNPKYKQARALKNVLDELFTEAMDEMEFTEQPTPPNNGKRNAAELNGAASSSAPAFNIPAAPAPRAHGGSAKKAKSGFEHFLDTFLGAADEEAALLEPVDDGHER
jgi:hypothetical protein